MIPSNEKIKCVLNGTHFFARTSQGLIFAKIEESHKGFCIFEGKIFRIETGVFTEFRKSKNWKSEANIDALFAYIVDNPVHPIELTQYMEFIEDRGIAITLYNIILNAKAMANGLVVLKSKLKKQ